VVIFSQFGVVAIPSEIGLADPTIHQIESVIKANKDRAQGDIKGKIATVQGFGSGLAGIRIRARSGKKNYETVTERDGDFHMIVPPGKYSLKAEPPSGSVWDSDYRFEESTNFTIYLGGCADLLLTPRER
jgi:hypothetical protein